MTYLIYCLVFVFYCINVIQAIEEACLSDSDCSKDKSLCIENVCQCDKLSVYSETVEECWNYVTEYAGDCFEDEQCTEFLGENGKCKNNKCLCDDGYGWLGGRCINYVGKNMSCSENITCLDVNDPLALTCTEGICKCSEGYYDRGLDCRVQSEYQKECAINKDCVSTAQSVSSYCKLGKCTKGSAPKIDFDENVIVFDSPLGFNDNNNDNCSQGILSNFTKEDCNKCPKYLYFRDAICICRPGYFLRDGQCIQELGMIDSLNQYNQDSDCPIKPGKLNNGICYCKNYWFQYYTNRECKKTTLQYTYNCMDNDWCKAMGPYAYCDSNSKQCKCIDQAVLNNDTFLCEIPGQPDLNGLCLEDTDCSLYQKCLDQKCQCEDGFIQNDDKCLPIIGGSCEIFNCSHIENAECSSDQTCQCKSSKYATDGYNCLEKATSLYDECIIEEQCQDIPHSACTNSNNGSYCLCQTDYSDKNNICYLKREYKSQCTTRLDCTILLDDSLVCRNSLCQCPVYYTYQNNVCVRSSSSKVLALYFMIWASVFVILM